MITKGLFCMDNIPPHILSYAKSDANSIIQSVNQFGNFNAELTQFNVILEDGVDPIYDVSVKIRVNYGFDPRRFVDFQWDYFVNGTEIRFWGVTDLSILANALKEKIVQMERM